MIAPTTPEDARYVADHLGDEEICVRLLGPVEASRLAYEVATTSPLSWAVYSAMGEPVAMFGADGVKGEEWGSAWMFCTKNVSKAKKALVQCAAAGIAISRDWWPELRIEAEPRSEKQMKFLEFLGFRPRATFERDGEFWMELAI